MKMHDIFKAGLVGLIVTALNLIPVDVEKTFGISLGNLGAMPLIYLIPMFIVYSLVAFVLSKIKNNLNLANKAAFITIFSFLFTINVLLINIEGNFYLSEYPLMFNLVYGLVLTLVITIAIFYLWKQGNNETDVKEQIKTHFTSRSIFSWIWRFALVLLLFYVIIMILGAITYPLTGSYLENGLFKIPSMLELFVITLFRSFVYLLVTLPFIVFWKAGNRSLFWYLALIHILIYPVLGDGFAYFWPAMYRLIDGLVLSTHVALMSWLYVALLKTK